MGHSTAKGYLNKSCLNEEKEYNVIRCNEQRQKFLPSGTRCRTSAASSRSCNNSNIATRYRATAAAAAEVHGRYIQMHTRMSCSSAQYGNWLYCFFITGPGTLLWNHARSLRNKRGTTTVITTHRAAAVATYETDCSIAQTTHRTYFYILEKKREMSLKKTK